MMALSYCGNFLKRGCVTQGKYACQLGSQKFHYQSYSFVACLLFQPVVVWFPDGWFFVSTSSFCRSSCSCLCGFQLVYQIFLVGYCGCVRSFFGAELWFDGFSSFLCHSLLIETVSRSCSVFYFYFLFYPLGNLYPLNVFLFIYQ